MNAEQRKLRADALRMARAEGWHYSKRNDRHEFFPGRFEVEPWPVVYFYACVMNGDGESLGDADRTDCDLLDVSADERAALDLAADTVAVAVTYTDQGFIGLRELNDAERDELIAAYAEPEYAVSVWEERDRLHIYLTGTDGTDRSWWDDDARRMFEDGFFTSSDIEGSVIDYAREHGLLGT